MESITDLIKSGLLKDLHIAERSFLLNKKINESQNDFTTVTKKDIALILFDLTYTEMILSLGRLYDTPNLIEKLLYWATLVTHSDYC